MYHKYISSYTLQKHITKLKHLPKYKHWYMLNAQAICNIADRIDDGYKLFFRNLKCNTKTSPPGFRKIHTYKSFTLRQNSIALLDNNKIRLGSRVYKYFKSRDIQGTIKTLTVKRDKLGDIYIYIVTDHVETRVIPRTGKSVGYDFGLKTFLTASDNQDIEAPQFFKQNRTAVAKANRNLSSKKSGSHNRSRARRELARVHKKVANRRTDFQWKLANDLTDQYDYLYFETLDIASMCKRWGKKINDLSFYSFMLKLKYLAAAKGKVVHCIDKYYPSSKTCSVCGYLYSDLELRDRTWLCPQCGTQHDRDRNASHNILRVGASTLAGGTVSPQLRHVPLIAQSDSL
jgi:putative transposase